MNIEVTIGVVINNSKVLIVKRKKGEGDLIWQFPGGTVEPNETDEQAVIREVKEETGCSISIVKLLGERIHPYTKKSMSYWACKYESGKIIVNDDDLEEARWVEKNELLSYFTTPIYEPIISYLQLS